MVHSRQLLQLPSLTPSVAASGATVLQAIDVTLLLTTTSAAQALFSHFGTCPSVT